MSKKCVSGHAWYSSGITLPDNVVAVPDIVEAASDADVLVFVIPHQFFERSCKPLVCSDIA